MALISEAKDGKDPAALRDKGRKAATMKVLGKRFLEEYVPVHCKPSTAYEYRRSVKFFIEPRIGTRKVTEIQRSDIAELHHGMREAPYQANRIPACFQRCSTWPSCGVCARTAPTPACTSSATRRRSAKGS